MFRKIISNLPFQPALLSKLSLYIRHLHKEEILRRTGFMLAILILITQILITQFHPGASLTTSPADIVYGANSRQEILQAYNDNRDGFGRTDIKPIFNYYGIGEAQIASSKATTIQENGTSNYIKASRNSTAMADTFVNILDANNGGVYEFPLSFWDNDNRVTNYSAITGMSSFGFRFWILLNGSGSIVYEKGAKKPSLEIIEQLTSNPRPVQDEIVTYSILFRNSGTSNSSDTTISNRLPTELEYQSFASNIDLDFKQSGQQLIWKIASKDGLLAPSTKWFNIIINAKVKNTDAPNQKSCFSSAINSSNGPMIISNYGELNNCLAITKPTCPGTGQNIPENDIAKCAINCPDGSVSSYGGTCKVQQLTCQSMKQIATLSWNTRKYRTLILSQEGANAQQITYFVNNKKVATESLMTNTKTHEFTYTYPTEGNYTITSELYSPNGTVQQSQNCTLSETITQPANPSAKISTDIKVSNTSQNIDNAINTTANPGDILKYTISLTNNGNKAANKFLIDKEYGEDISDILEYADLTNQYDAIFNEKTGFLSWGPIDIQPGEKFQKTFTVTVKNPLPATPISKSNPLSFNYEMSNKYGRNTSIMLNKPITKIVEQATTNLPKLNNFVCLLISFITLLVIGYFYYRSRLLKKESAIIHQEYSSGGL